MNDWNIQGRAHGCQACEKAFADKQPYHTLLFDQKQMYQRLDICDACWQTQYSQGASERKGFVSYWHGVYLAPAPPAPEAIQKENAESLLRKLMEQDDPKYMAASYILAVMLERKRLLKIKEQYHRDGQRVFVYEQPRTGDIFTIPDPNLQLDQLGEVQQEVASLLEHGLNPPPLQASESDPNAAPIVAGAETSDTPSAAEVIETPNSPSPEGQTPAPAEEPAPNPPLPS